MPATEFDQAATTTLAVLCKRPRVGVGKQRVAADIGARPAVELAALLLDCVLEDLRAWPGRRVISPASADDAQWAGGLLDEADIVPQAAGNLGVRINVLDASLRASGHSRVIYLGSDAPLIDGAYLAAAADALATGDVVLGAAADGGVILMGAAAPWPDLAGLPWSTAELGRGLAGICERAGLHTAWLEAGMDIDESADFKPLARGLAGDSRPARRALAAWLETLGHDGEPTRIGRRGAHRCTTPDGTTP
jgi:glycosyltransferase A (GT-A) superfamily protein (DUF2064 family)